MPTGLESAVYRTLAYFAYFNYPLTAFEVWKWLLEPERAMTLAEVIEVLESSAWLRSRIQIESGFYALGPVSEWCQTRHLRFLDAMRKYRKVTKAVQVLGRLPWINGIAVCNSLAWYQTGEASDIDLFIVAKQGRVWSSRLLATVPAILLRQRPAAGVKDPICLSFFCTEDALDFQSLKIGESDPYLGYWCSSLVPLVDHSGWLERFKASNSWLSKALPHAQTVRRAHRFRSRRTWRLPWLPLSEKLPKQLQMNRFPTSIRTLMNLDTRVIVSDQMLKFHDQDRREEIRVSLAEAMSRV